MKKRRFAALLLALAALPFGACAGGGGNGSGAGSGGGAEPEPPAAVTRPLPYQYLAKFTEAETPAFEYADGYAYGGGSEIKAIEYRGADYMGLRTKVFAYIGFPAGASAENKVPAVVLVHGGGGTAFPEWVRAWNERGYAAISMDTEGRRPDRSRNGLNGPANDYLLTETKPLNEQWMYHAVSSVVLAHTLLRADERVDAGKTGFMGVSWGSVVSCVAAGIDNRFSFGVSVYGGGFLNEGSSGFSYYGISDASWALWEPSLYFPEVKADMLFVNSDHDTSFSPDITYKSARAVGGRHTYIAVHTHGQSEAMALTEPYIFADESVKGEPARARIESAAREGDWYRGEPARARIESAAREEGDWYRVTYSLPEGATLAGVQVYKKVLPIGYERAGLGYALPNEDFSEAKTPLMFDAPTGSFTFRIPWSARVVYFNLLTEKDGRIAVASSRLYDIEGAGQGAGNSG
ncbi:MAG: acetylxylan esterase [Clostridiales bacterium]|jgi:dienelactone hydrolase|nr:acetylxylan esterase [Clostridiales bacterium]